MTDKNHVNAERVHWTVSDISFIAYSERFCIMALLPIAEARVTNSAAYHIRSRWYIEMLIYIPKC